MKIIFICKYNAFRSKIAENYFNKINKNKNIKAVSRGVIMGTQADKAQKKIAKQMDVEIKGPSNPVNLPELKKADLIIVVAKDVPRQMFDYWKIPLKKKLLKWRIKDEQMENTKNIKNIVKLIKKKVDKLTKKLENTK